MNLSIGMRESFNYSVVFYQLSYTGEPRTKLAFSKPSLSLVSSACFFSKASEEKKNLKMVS